MDGEGVSGVELCRSAKSQHTRGASYSVSSQAILSSRAILCIKVETIQTWGCTRTCARRSPSKLCVDSRSCAALLRTLAGSWKASPSRVVCNKDPKAIVTTGEIAALLRRRLELSSVLPPDADSLAADVDCLAAGADCLAVAADSLA